MGGIDQRVIEGWGEQVKTSWLDREQQRLYEGPGGRRSTIVLAGGEVGSGRSHLHLVSATDPAREPVPAAATAKSLKLRRGDEILVTGRKDDIEAAPTRLLLIEDNPGDARLVREMLRFRDSFLVSFQHVERLVDARGHLDAAECVLLDLSLPDSDRLEGIEQLRSLAPEVPIVVLTSLEDETLAVEAVRKGAQDYLVKGRVDGQLLSHSIRYAIERKRLEAKLAYQATHDAVTGLANRILLLDRLSQALLRSERNGSTVAVLFFDLDRFKAFNDSFGHDIGDDLLVAVADRVRRVLRPADMAARFGGDEFAVVCEDISSEHHVIEIANRLGAAIELPITLNENDHVVTASVGIALGRGDELRAEEMLRDADIAMYRAKELGRGRSEIFDQEIARRVHERYRIESDLRSALAEGQFELFYQPQFELGTGAFTGVEALIRWNHPTRGTVRPLDFIGIAEENGFIVPLGRWIIETSCEQFSTWRSEQKDVIVSVNLSARQLLESDLVETVATAIRRIGVEPRVLRFEITETVLMENLKASIAVMDELKGLGVSLAIDDFGTGYSSLSYLKSLPFDLVKLDGTLMEDVDRNPQALAIVRAIVDLAHALNLLVVAEGIETSEQLVALEGLGCDYGQGYFLGKPDRADMIAASRGR